MKKAVANGGPARSQILYNCGLCLWQLSFDELAMQQLRKSRCVEPLVDLLKQGALLTFMRSVFILALFCEPLSESIQLILAQTFT